MYAFLLWSCTFSLIIRLLLLIYSLPSKVICRHDTPNSWSKVNWSSVPIIPLVDNKYENWQLFFSEILFKSLHSFTNLLNSNIGSPPKRVMSASAILFSKIKISIALTIFSNDDVVEDSLIIPFSKQYEHFKSQVVVKVIIILTRFLPVYCLKDIISGIDKSWRILFGSSDTNFFLKQSKYVCSLIFLKYTKLFFSFNSYLQLSL